MMRGSTAADAAARIFAMGFFPLRFPQAREPMTRAAAPSLTPEALPAVTTPPSYSGFSLASDSIVESRRGGSSWGTVTAGGAFFFFGRLYGGISPLLEHSASAFA